MLGVTAWLAIAFLTRPLVHGSGHGYPGFETSESNDPFSTATGLSYEHGYEGTIILSVRNSGFLPLVVKNISVFPAVDDDMRASLIRQTAVIVDRESDLTDRVGGEITDGAAFPGDSLPMGARRQHEMLVDIRFDDCDQYSPGITLGFDRMYLDYSILGIPRRAEVMISPIWVVSPERRDCPDD